MSRAGRDRRAGALLKSRAATLRQLAREAKRLRRPNATANTRQARQSIAARLAQLGGELYTAAADLLDQSDMPPEAAAAQKMLRAGIQQWERIRAGPS